MNEKLKEKIREALTSVLPITAIVLLVSVTLVPLEVGTLVMFLAGAMLLIIGMGFFQLGAEMAMTPLGEGLGRILGKNGRLGIVIPVVFLLGTIVTIAEPDLQILANQVASIPSKTLIWTVAVGVGIFLAIAAMKILLRIDLTKILLGSYALLFLLAAFAPAAFIPVAFDAGGVTTGPITVPFIMALGVGLSAARKKSDEDDSFGLVALSSVGPIMMVLVLGICYHPTEASYTPVEVGTVITTYDVAVCFLKAFPQYAKEVLRSLMPIIAVFLLLQLLTKCYRRRQLVKMCVGFLYTGIGLILFLTGVNVGFTPVGNLLGSGIASSQIKWLLILIGGLIGYYIVKAEPAVQVLNRQVETATGGMVSRSMMNTALSAGVAGAVALSMLRVLTGINILWIIIPGYAVALILSKYVSPIFVGIAFDSGGVASGPMTSTFLIPLAMGACMAVGGNVVTDAFGVVALVALAPPVTVQIMGAVYLLRIKKERGIYERIGIDDSIVDLED